MRESPTLVLAERLTAEGATVVAHDPVVGAAAGRVLPDGVVLTRDLAEAVGGADAAVIVTAWPQYRGLLEPGLSATMARPLLVDGTQHARTRTPRPRAGYEWVGIGAPQYAGEHGEWQLPDGACPMSWLDPVRAGARRARGPAAPSSSATTTRDGDDDRLAACSTVFDAHGVGVDVAVIPALVHASLAAELGAPDRGGGRAGAPARPGARQPRAGPGASTSSGRRAARPGRPATSPTGERLMLDWFGEAARGPGVHPALEPLHRPPPARPCSATVCACSPATTPHAPLTLPDLAEVPVTLDWFGHRKGVRWTPAELASRLADQAARRRPRSG